MNSKVTNPAFSLSPPHFGQFVTWILIWIAIAKTYFSCPVVPGDRIGPVSVISLLPDGIISDSAIFFALRATLVVAGILWALHLALPYSSWSTVVLFTLVVALRYENTYQISHVYHVANMLMVIHAAWYHFYHREIRQALQERRFWKTNLYPRWVFLLSVFYIGLFHTLAGVSKLTTSGLQWADGLSLQLWMHLWGQAGSPLRDLVVSHRDLAMILQIGTLILETAAIVALVSPLLRKIIGVGLVSFYFGVISTFGWHFHFNMLFVALFFLPVDAAVARVSAFMSQRVSIRLVARTTGQHLEHLIAAFVHRCDFFQIVDLQFRPR